MSSLRDVIKFFSEEQVPMLPCHAVVDGVCTCRKGRSCPSPGKHPLMVNWQGAASTDQTKVLSWFSSSKPVNLAIATGRRNSNGRYLVAVDADIVDHQFIKELRAHGETVTQKSGSGGSHALYWSDVPVKNSCQLLDEKVDIRGSGGILVVAPSTHKSGNKYEFTCDIKTVKIQQTPKFLEMKLFVATQVIKEGRKRKAASTPIKVDKESLQKLSQEWSSKPISEIKKLLENKESFIPYGIRNTTMHRLLSSDRAKGATKAQLESHALNYLSNFQDADNFLDEVLDIVDSVMKYQPYNNSHERVNEIYFKWLKKHGIVPDCSLEVLDGLDQEFFSRVKPMHGEETVLLSLKEISDLRGSFFFSKGHTRFSAYKSQLLAKKLLEIGAIKRRRAKNNLWEVNHRILGLEVQPKGHYHVLEEINMSEKDSKTVNDGDIIERNGEKLRVEIIKRDIPAEEHSKEHLFSGRFGIDYNTALIKYLASLTEEQSMELEAETLVLDRQSTLELVESMLPGDIIGFGCETYRVAQRDGLKLLLEPVVKVRVKNKVGQFEGTGDETDFVTPSEHELDKFRVLGFLQILWRDGTPFGESSTKNIKIVLFHPVLEQNSGVNEDERSTKSI